MLSTIVRLVKRFLVFLPGIGISVLAVQDLYPVLDRRLPAAVAVLATYILSAYVFIPAGIRIIRYFSKPKHVPFYSVTPDGFASDPVNIAVLSSREALAEAFRKTGWHVSDPKTPKTLFKLIVNTLLDQPYLNAPFSNLYLFGRSQDIGFQLQAEDNPGFRHHVRFWAVKPETAEGFKEHVAFWQAHHPSDQGLEDKFLWLGAASRDIGLGLIRHNAQLSHMIHPDTNAERDLIAEGLEKTGLVQNTKTVQIASPYQLRNRVLTGYLEADGRLTILEL